MRCLFLLHVQNVVYHLLAKRHWKGMPESGNHDVCLNMEIPLTIFHDGSNIQKIEFAKKFMKGGSLALYKMDTENNASKRRATPNRARSSASREYAAVDMLGSCQRSSEYGGDILARKLNFLENVTNLPPHGRHFGRWWR